ncbi:hypothetical protein ACI8AF_08280 [Blastococcus sp. SYSU D00669]
MARPARRLPLLLLGVVLVAAAVVAGLVAGRGGDDGAEAAAGSSTAAPTVVTEPPPGAPVVTDAPVPEVPSGVPLEVVVTYSGWDDDAQVAEAAGLVPGLVESGGTCELTLTRERTTVTGQAAAESDGRSTWCGSVTVAGGDLTPGTWSAVLSYRSATASGATDAFDLEVPEQ